MSVIIREVDKTSTEKVINNTYTVLVPGPICTVGTDVMNVDGLYTTLEDFMYVFSSSANITDSDDDVVFSLIQKYFEQGLNVQYFAAYPFKFNLSTVTTTTKVNTSDTTTLIENIKSKYAEFSDKAKYDLLFISTGSINLTGSVALTDAVEEAAIRCAGNRGDAVAILSANATCKTADTINTNVNQATKLVFYESTITRGNESLGVTKDEVYGAYAAMFPPSVILDGNTYYPGAFDYLTCFGKYARKYAPWKAMSGSFRGVSPYKTLTTNRSFGETALQLLQPRTITKTDSHSSVNVITEVKPYGTLIWGNRTLFPLTSKKPELCASSFLNIRILCCLIKKTLYRATRRYSFESNTDILWTNFKSDIIPLLEEMKAKEGIRGYQIIRVATNKKAVLAAKIKIIPIEPVEDFDLSIELNDSITAE